MAKKTVIICDFGEDEHFATETLRMKINAYLSTVDVCKEHGREVRTAMLPFMKAGKESGVAPKTINGSAPLDPEQARAIREWAALNDVPYNSRGRLSQATIDAYQEAHS